MPLCRSASVADFPSTVIFVALLAVSVTLLDLSLVSRTILLLVLSAELITQD